MQVDSRKDKELVKAFVGGEEEAYLELIRRYTEKVHNLALRITRNESDTEEILQEVFITLHTKMHTFRGTSAFSSWLYRITANTSFMKLRNRKKHSSVSIEAVPESAGMNNWHGTRSDTCDVNYMSARHELREFLQEAIEKLPEEYRTIFILRDVDGLSNQEVGEVLGISVPAVKSRLHRSRIMLRRKLQRYYDDYTSTSHISYGYHPAARGFEYAEAA